MTHFLREQLFIVSISIDKTYVLVAISIFSISFCLFHIGYLGGRGITLRWCGSAG
jgi:hypothetical protein